MEIKASSKLKMKQREILQSEISSKKKVDINILLNKVKIEKKNEIKKKFIVAFSVVGSLLVTGFIAVL